MNVVVFGSSRPGLDEYQQAQRLGELLGRAGHTVLTGGYMGTMEAVSRGASDAGAHVIGVTCAEIENWRPTRANAWVKEEVRMATLNERLHALITRSDAALALPGGPGTLTEIALSWNLLVIQAVPPRPLILIGQGWEKTFTTLFAAQPDYYADYERGWLRFAADIDSAVEMLHAYQN